MQCLLLKSSAIMAAAVTVMPLSAQVPLRTAEQAKQVRRALSNGAQCLLNDRMGAVKSFLAKFPTSKDGIRMTRVLVAGDCVDGASGTQELTFSPDVIRGALFKALYNQDFGEVQVRLKNPGPDFALDVGTNSAELGKPYVAARAFGSCVVHRDPRASRDLVMADVETDAEYTAFSALAKPLAECAASTPGLPAMSRMLAVGSIAEVLYRSSEKVEGARG